MNAEVKNWVNDFGINEMLHSTAQGLAGVYARLSYKFEDHPSAGEWDRKSIEWANYDRSIGDMFFDQEDKANLEVSRVANEFQIASALEKDLLTKPA